MKEDLYWHKRWRLVQFLANQFWNRWRVEYLPALQQRSKWNKQHRNLKTDDIVLVKDECSPRCQWPLMVRKVKVMIGSSTYDRPVHKLAHLFAPGNTDEEPN